MRHRLLAPVACTALLVTGPAWADRPAPVQPLPGDDLFTPQQCGGAIWPGADASVSTAVDPKDSDHVVLAWSRDRVAGVQVAATRDGGRSWRQAVPPGMRTCGANDADRATEPRVAVTAGGSAFVATFVRDDATTAVGRIVVAHSSDGGGTWSPASSPEATQPLPAEDFDDLVADPEARDGAYALWNVPEGIGELQLLSRTVDGGRTWQTSLVRQAAPGTAGWSQLLALPGGRLVLAVLESPLAELVSDTAQPAKVLVLTSADRGATWSAPVTAGTATALQWPSLASSLDGREVWLSWVAPQAGQVCRRVPLGDARGRCQVQVVGSTDGARTFGPPATVASWDGPWVPTPSLARTARGDLATVLLVPRGAATADVVVARSDDGRQWQRDALVRSVAVDGASGEPQGLGQFSETVAADGQVLSGLALGRPVAVVGPTDPLLAALRLR